MLVFLCMKPKDFLEQIQTCSFECLWCHLHRFFPLKHQNYLDLWRNHFKGDYVFITLLFFFFFSQRWKIMSKINYLTSYRVETQKSPNLTGKTKYHQFTYLGGHCWKILLFVRERTLYSEALETFTLYYLMSNLPNQCSKIPKKFEVHFKKESLEVFWIC